MTPIEHTILARKLVELGHVTLDEISMAEIERRRSGESLTSVLRTLRMVTEEEIANVSASALGLERLNPTVADIDRERTLQISVDYAKDHLIVPLSRDKYPIPSVVMADASDVDATDRYATLVGEEPQIFVAPESQIRSLIDALSHTGHSLDTTIEATIREAMAIAGQETQDASEAVPMVRLVDQIVELGIREQATDIHLEPEEKVLRVRMRIDGLLQQGPMLPKELQVGVITRFKVMADLNISEKRLPQDGRIHFRLEEKEYDLRVSVLPTAHGENVVLRVLDKSSLPMDLELLGMARDTLDQLHRTISNPYGVFLVTGPTGSGKSTTLYASLGLLDAVHTKIVTVEDPIEYQFPLIRQCQINTAAGLTFAAGLRSILRQDPDAILVGEVRDLETAQIAIRAGLTGHLVLTTLHTNTSVGAVPRLVDMGLERFLITSSVLGALAQRLVRRLCMHCREPANVADQYRPVVEAAGCPDGEFYRAKGCPACRQSGYRGRMGIHEIFIPNDEARRAITEGAGEEQLMTLARNAGMRTLMEDGLLKAAKGETSIEEVFRVTQVGDL